MLVRSILSAGVLAVAATGALAQATTPAATTPAATPPAAAQSGENVARDAQKSGDMAVKQLMLSDELAAYGRANKDPLSLIVAAQIRKATPAKTVDRQPEGAGADAIGKAPAGDSVDALLKEATDLSKGDKTVAALASDVKSSATKGRVGGATMSYGQITGRTDHNIKASFQGGRHAEVALAGVSSNLFVLEIRDQNGNLICRDSAPAYCSFNPIWTGPFTMKVKNLGSGLAHYKLATN